MSDMNAPTVDVQLCFYLLDDYPAVGIFHKDSDGYGYCDDIMVAEPGGHPIQNIDEYRLTTLSVPVKPNGSYDRPNIISRLWDGFDDIIKKYEPDWDEQSKQSCALWESIFGQTERHAW
ncbi:hypothetical protein [Bifidobacterium oedipodis]|uniref:Uncharacterized protein n=1 Tax=Bifidobacterium oedipodis TaxID=2675322 RepID=A0A7Y0ENF3_9BIFI|nr:hypothetical protein [Bifidobacterium sp. DSM 109957]NMM93474.1 hypothetical protein [Bifidobacterium sp. DSM 109957]